MATRLPTVCASFRAAGDLRPNGRVDILRYARMCDQLGFGDFDAADHIVLRRSAADYPGGEFRWAPDSLWPDPFVLLSAVGAVTDRMRLTTGVLVAPLRPAIVTAKLAATLDNLTSGRLRLGP